MKFYVILEKNVVFQSSHQGSQGLPQYAPECGQDSRGMFCDAPESHYGDPGVERIQIS